MTGETIEWGNPAAGGQMEEQGMGVMRWQRRQVLATAAALLAARVVGGGATPVGAQGMASLYARPTGHTIPANLRPLWESLGGVDGLGWPLDEVQPTPTGTEQWFQYGRIYGNVLGQPALATVGREGARFRSVMTNFAFTPKPPPLPGLNLPNAQYVPVTGHTAANGFLSLWTGRQALLGAPISEEFTENGALVQYFENGRLEYDPTATLDSGPRITMIGVLLHGPAAPAVDPPAGVEFIGTAPVTSISGVAAHPGHWVLVNLAQQHLQAYDGMTLVRELDVSTGLDEHPTPTGSYQVMQRYADTPMVGPGYNIPHVYWTQYFGNDDLSWHQGYSLHGADWHHNWGHQMSHGCVNLPEDFAEWLWNWSDTGLPVEIIAG